MGIDQDDRVRYLQGSLQGFRGSFTSIIVLSMISVVDFFDIVFIIASICAMFSNVVAFLLSIDANGAAGLMSVLIRWQRNFFPKAKPTDESDFASNVKLFLFLYMINRISVWGNLRNDFAFPYTTHNGWRTAR